MVKLSEGRYFKLTRPCYTYKGERIPQGAVVHAVYARNPVGDGMVGPFWAGTCVLMQDMNGHQFVVNPEHMRPVKSH